MKGLLLLIFIQSSLALAQNVVLQDSFVFKVMGEIISVREIQGNIEKLDSLNCYFSKSLIMQEFKEFYQSSKSIDYDKLISKKPPFSSREGKFFELAVKFFKLKAYIKAQKVEFGSKYGKALYLVGKSNLCKTNFFIEKYKIEQSYLDIFQMEIFMRARFIPESSKLLEKIQIGGVGGNVTLFVDSIAKQVEDVPLWK